MEGINKTTKNKHFIVIYSLIILVVLMFLGLITLTIYIPLARFDILILLSFSVNAPVNTNFPWILNNCMVAFSLLFMVIKSGDGLGYITKLLNVYFTGLL
jgi:hypothetical protein